MIAALAGRRARAGRALRSPPPGGAHGRAARAGARAARRPRPRARDRRTVLERARYLHEHYELERCRVLLVGDHDATSLAFDVLGLHPRELAVVDVDQRLLAFLAPDAYFADLRVGLPAPLRGRFDLVLTDPPYSPAGVGLFAARGLEALPRPADAAADRLRLSARLARARAQGPGRAERARARLRGGAARLQRLRRRAGDRLARRALRAAPDQAQPQDRGAPRRAARRRALHPRAPGARVRQQRCRTSASSPASLAPLRRLAGASAAGRSPSCSRRPQAAETVYVNLAPDLVYSLYQAAVAAARRTR